MRGLAARLADIREAAIDLRDFVPDMETTAFHALPQADRTGYRAVKNALIELGEAVKAIPDEVRQRRLGWRETPDWRDDGSARLRRLNLPRAACIPSQPV